MGNFTGTVRYTADDEADYQQAMASVIERPEFVLISNNEENKTIDIELV